MRDWIDTYWENEAIPGLIEFGKIPNVSQEYAPNWKSEGHMAQAAAFLKQWASARAIAGARVSVIEKNEKAPVLVVEVPGSGDTVLFYGHMDKQPPMLPWREGLDPWNPIREGDLLYGRGLADDGYALFAALGAIEAAQKTGKQLPRVVILIEAGEESGSPDLPMYLEELKEVIGSPRTIMTLDSEGNDNERLWLTKSVRGAIGGFLTVQTIGEVMHSGSATGVVPSVMRIVRLLLARIEDPVTGHILLAEANPPLSDELRAYARTVAEHSPNYLDLYHLPKNLTVSGSLEEVVERNLVMAGLEVTGITGYPEARVSGNITVPSITLRLSMRIPPQVEAGPAKEAIKRALEENPPYGARVVYEPASSDQGWFAKPYTQETEMRIRKASEEVYGNTPGIVGVGGSIPFIQMMTRRFPDAEHLTIGILNHASNAHGPNENMCISRVKKLTEFLALFLTQ